MKNSHSSWTTQDRLRALAEYGILDTPPEREFDDIVEMAARACDVPIALINLLDADRQWFKAEVGMGIRQMPLDASICARAVAQGDVLVVRDTLDDERFSNNPYVCGPPHIRHYAGVVLRTPESIPIGTLCILDHRPRDLTDAQLFMLRALARTVMAQLELRRALAAGENARAMQRRSEARSRQILDSATDFAIIATDLDGLVTSWNKGAMHVLGWTEDEMIGQTAARIFTPEDRAGGRPQCEMHGALATGASNDERWHLRKSGERFWASGQMTPLRDEAGKAVGFVKMLRDRTEAHTARIREQAAAAALRESEQFSRKILESTPDCIKVLTLDGKLDFMSERGLCAMEIDDFSRVRGCSWPAMWPADTVEQVADAVTQARAGGTGQFTAQGPTAKGNMRWWQVVVSPIVDAHGEPEKLLAISRDISAEKEAATILQQSQDRFKQLTELSPALVWFSDPAGQLTYLNEHYYVLTGATGDEALGTGWTRFLHADDVPRVLAVWQKAVAECAPLDVDCRVRRRDGEYRWYNARATPLRDAHGRVTGWLGSNADVTALKMAEAELLQLNETLEERIEARTRELQATEDRLRQSQKMEAVGQLTGSLAHDFNNLLTGISGSLELLQSRVAQGRVGDLDRYIAAAQGASKRAAALTHRLLAFSRRQTLAPRPTDVNRLVRGMEELIRRTAGPGITAEVVQAPGLWNTLVDANQLENALLNLCINGRDAMPDGGWLTIETGNTWLDARAAGERDLPPGQYVSLCVSDTGSGMSPDIIDRAFDPFFTTKPLGQGTGLGLSMIYGFARQSGGQARIFSEPGQGTRVCLVLPRHLGEAERAELPAELTEAPRAEQGETVLVVDDEPSVRMLVTEVLEELGYTAIEAGDSIAGLKVLQSDARVDLLVTDVGLPNGMNGRQLADAGRTVRPGLKVLFITGYAENAVLGNGHLEHGMHVLTKPFAMEALASQIKDLITGT